MQRCTAQGFAPIGVAEIEILNINRVVHNASDLVLYGEHRILAHEARFPPQVGEG
jgi:hypothetical protein